MPPRIGSTSTEPDKYLVDSLDLEKRDIIARRSDLNYFTRVRTEKHGDHQGDQSRPEGQFIVREGLLRVTEHVVGYEKRALPGRNSWEYFHSIFRSRPLKPSDSGSR